MNNLQKISRKGLRSIRGGTVTCSLPGTSDPAIWPGKICPPDPCISGNCIIPISGCPDPF